MLSLSSFENGNNNANLCKPIYEILIKRNLYYSQQIWLLSYNPSQQKGQ